MRNKIIIAILVWFAFLMACQPLPTPTTTGTTTTSTPITQDATASIQANLNQNKYFYVDRNYIVDGTIIPPTGSRIVFAPGGQFTRTSNAAAIRNMPVLRLTQGNITVESPKIVGPNPCYWTYFDTGYKYSKYDATKEANHAISIEGGATYLINNPNISSVWGDAINIDKNAQNITINNLKANCVGRSIISNTGSTNTTVNGGESYGAFYWTFNIEPFADREVRNYKVNNFKVGFSRAQAIFSDGPDFNCKVFDVDFTNITYLTAYKEVSINPCVAAQISY